MPRSERRRNRQDRRARQDWREDYGLIGAARQTRKPIAPWDRVKFLILFAGLWFIVVWYQMSVFPYYLPR